MNLPSWDAIVRSTDVWHGAHPTDPVPNESDCCFGCSYHNCMVANCEVCDELMVWDEDPDRWRHLDPPEDGHGSTWGPPEHWEWVLQQRAHLDGGRLEP